MTNEGRQLPPFVCYLSVKDWNFMPLLHNQHVRHQLQLRRTYNPFLSYLLSNAAKLRKSCETCIFKLFLLLKIRGGIRFDWKNRRNFELEICRLFENGPLIGFCDCMFLNRMVIDCVLNSLFCFLFVSCVLAQLWMQLESKRKDLLKRRIVVGINVRFTL